MPSVKFWQQRPNESNPPSGSTGKQVLRNHHCHLPKCRFPIQKVLLRWSIHDFACGPKTGLVFDAFFCVVICWGGGGVIMSCVFVVIELLRWTQYQTLHTFPLLRWTHFTLRWTRLLWGGSVITSRVFVVIQLLRWTKFMLHYVTLRTSFILGWTDFMLHCARLLFWVHCARLLFLGEHTSCHVAHVFCTSVNTLHVTLRTSFVLGWTHFMSRCTRLLYLGEHTSCYVAHVWCTWVNTLHVALHIGGFRHGSCVHTLIYTMWGPPIISWFVNPINYSYKYNKP